MSDFIAKIIEANEQNFGGITVTADGKNCESSGGVEIDEDSDASYVKANELFGDTV